MSQPLPAARPPFTLLAVGLVMTVVDLRVNGLDLIPDCVGFLLATIALYQLQRLDPLFGWACMITAVMTPVAIVSLRRPPGSSGLKTGSGLGDAAWALATIAVDFLICAGIASAAQRQGDAALAATAYRRRLLVLLTGFSIVPVWLLRHAPPGIILPLLIGVALFVIVVFCLVLGLMRQAGRRLRPPALAT